MRETINARDIKNITKFAAAGMNAAAISQSLGLVQGRVEQFMPKENGDAAPEPESPAGEEPAAEAVAEPEEAEAEAETETEAAEA